MDIEFSADTPDRFCKPWLETGQTPAVWFEENFERFVFPDDYAVSSAVPYSYHDGPCESGVYFLIEDNRVVYVGKAANISKRLFAHYLSKRFTHYWCFGGIPDMFMEDVEAFYILRFAPPLNVKPGRCDPFVKWLATSLNKSLNY